MFPLVVPKQSVPVLNGKVFVDDWYLFFQVIQTYASTAAGIVQYGDRSDREDADTSSLTDGTLWLESDTGLVYQWRAQLLEWVYVAGAQVGPFANRPTGLGANDAGVLYQTYDTFQLYQWSGTAWALFTQVYQRTQTQLSALAGILGTDDAGLLVEVTDYAHVLRWTGTGWSWGPGESGSGMFVPFAAAPTGNGWHLCDGSSGVKYLKSDGTLSAGITLPDTNSTAAFLKLGSAYASAITTAVVPTISAPTFTGTPGTTGTPSTNTGTTAGAANVGSSIHTHTFLPTGTVSAPIATLPGDPVANFEALLYFRQ